MSSPDEYSFLIVYMNDSGLRDKIVEKGGIIQGRVTSNSKYVILDCSKEDLSTSIQKKLEGYIQRNLQVVDSKWVEDNFLNKDFPEDDVSEDKEDIDANDTKSATKRTTSEVDDSQSIAQSRPKRNCNTVKKEDKKVKEEPKVKKCFDDQKFYIAGKLSQAFSTISRLITSNGGKLVEDSTDATVILSTVQNYINKISKLMIAIQDAPSIPIYTDAYIVDSVENTLHSLDEYNVIKLYENLYDVPKEEKIIKITKRVDDLIAVDPFVPDNIREKCQVYVENNVIWSAMLNQSSIVGNHNKFYLLQVLQSLTGFTYYIFFRWGRVGDKGMQSIESSCLEDCKAAFEKKFFDKTKNQWSELDHFKPVGGKYTYIKMKISKNDDKKDDKNKSDKDSKEKQEQLVPKCTLPDSIQEVLHLLYNIKQFNEEMEEEGLDINKMPLGELDSSTITKGYKVLLEIEKVLKNKSKKDLDDLSSEFYTLIPHNFGRRHMSAFRLDTLIALQKKIDLLSCLSNLKQYSVIEKKNVASTEDPLTVKYNNLRCSLTPLDPKSKIYDYIISYANVRGNTHSYLKFKVLNVFAMNRLDEVCNITIGNKGTKKLLWHGTQLVNCVSILSRGLLIAPPEATITGHMFGKGVYFADIISKSAQYCRASRTYPRCFMLLAEVDTGRENELIHADYNANSDLKGFDTVKGCGSNVPSKWIDYEGVSIPNGPIKHLSENYDLLYNEYIVYDTNRISLKYLVEIEFEY